MQQDNPTIPADLMRELIGPVGSTLDGYTCADDYPAENDYARWGEPRRIVVRHEATGRYYQARYVAVSGDEGGLDFGGDDEVPVIEVEPVEVTTIKWGVVDTSAEQ